MDKVSLGIILSQNDHIGRTSDWKTRGAVNGDGGSLPGGENGKRLMVTEQGGDQLLYSSHYPLSLPGSTMTTKILQMIMMMMVWQRKAASSCSSS